VSGRVIFEDWSLRGGFELEKKNTINFGIFIIAKHDSSGRELSANVDLVLCIIYDFELSPTQIIK
jgi:hypothetical protein